MLRQPTHDRRPSRRQQSLLGSARSAQGDPSPVRRTTIGTLLAPALLVALLLAACGGRSVDRPHVATPAVAPASTTTSILSIAASRATSYTSLADLARDATMVIIGTAGSGTTRTIGGIPFTTTEVRVDRAFTQNVAAGADVLVHQTGGPGIVSPDLPPVLERDQRYLLFLEPFTGPGSDTTSARRYTIVGLAGIWGLRGDSARRLDPLSTELPDRLSVQALEGQVREALRA